MDQSEFKLEKVRLKEDRASQTIEQDWEDCTLEDKDLDSSLNFALKPQKYVTEIGRLMRPRCRRADFCVHPTESEGSFHWAALSLDQMDGC